MHMCVLRSMIWIYFLDIVKIITLVLRTTLPNKLWVQVRVYCTYTSRNNFFCYTYICSSSSKCESFVYVKTCSVISWPSIIKRKTSENTNLRNSTKFDGQNFWLWKFQVKVMPVAHGLLNIVKGI